MDRKPGGSTPQPFPPGVPRSRNPGNVVQPENDDDERGSTICQCAHNVGQLPLEPGGQNNLDAMYLSGRGVTQNDVLGAKWIFSAAQQGVAEAQYGFGTLYANGRGVPRDDVQAVKWLQAAAAQNYAPAQLVLGKMYAAGLGVPRDYTLALKSFQAANVPEAWFQIGLLHSRPSLWLISLGMVLPTLIDMC